MIPIYDNTTTPEQRQQALELMAVQVGMLHDQQDHCVPLMDVKIRCGCGKESLWWAMYRCLYCGIFFCKSCAEQHFGARVPDKY